MQGGAASTRDEGIQIIPALLAGHRFQLDQTASTTMDSINHPGLRISGEYLKKKVSSNRRGVLKRFDYFQTNGWVEAIEEKYYEQFREVCASYETVGNNILRRGVIDSTANQLDVLKELKVYN